MAIPVLYIHISGVFGGASRSLLELLKHGSESGSVSPCLLLPKGNAYHHLQPYTEWCYTVPGIPQFDNTRFGHYRGLRWLILIRELFFLPGFWISLRRIQRERPDLQLIHVNEITAILPAVLAKRLLELPLVLHVRSLQSGWEGAARRSRWISKLVKRYVDQVIVIDETVKKHLPDSDSALVVHNGFKPEGIDKAPVEESLLTGKKPVVFAMVGGLLEMKGVFDFVEAAKLLLDQEREAEFWLVGENVRTLQGLKATLLKKIGFYRNVKEELNQFVIENGLQTKIKVKPFTTDIAAVYREIDVLCFPSHLNAAGRPVFEAAFFGKPSIVALNDPLPDTLIPGETGLAISEKDPQGLAQAMQFLLDSPAERRRMGQEALGLANRYFDAEKNSQTIIARYRSLIK